ncbi:MAG: hypothetical protein QW474_02970 [Candidatus Aenigmatarchaeota archaeon]
MLKIKKKIDNKLDLKDKADYYYECYKNIVSFKKSIERDYLKLGIYLKMVKDYKLYEVNGLTWTSFLAQPEINLSREWANKLIKITEKFMIDINKDDYLIQLSNVGVSKLSLVLPLLEKNYKTKEELIDEIVNLSYRDTKEYVKEVLGINNGIDVYNKAEAIKQKISELIKFLDSLNQEGIIQILDLNKLKIKVEEFIIKSFVE